MVGKRVFQTFNKTRGAFVKIKTEGGVTRFQDVKQRNPRVPFKGVPIRRNVRR